MVDHRTREAAVADARLATACFDDALAWLAARPVLTDPLAAEVWVYDSTFTSVLLVRHPRRGLVAPGGTVEPGETPREAAARELHEETGVRAELLPAPAAVAVRSYRADWSPTLSLVYAAVVALAGEPGQPPRWVSLDRTWDSVFPEDRARLRAHGRHLAG
ncbi:NUDIX domain-containing protein [Lentzea sp. NPDC003310]|uniref:NUDIX domain-containing protein n=1 Tax=Lentzea sp. NPDC003310 TaxID=3154447 RepID=UPI0033A06E99